MDSLIKIRDVSTRYDISARTLRYYEDMGLISSTRSDDYAYRMYDEAAVKRLEQILILRKLNISIKDIQRIFNTSASEVVLEVLGKKVDDIDGAQNVGDFQPKTVEVVFTSSDWIEKKSGWYAGKAQKTVDIKLKKK